VQRDTSTDDSPELPLGPDVATGSGTESRRPSGSRRREPRGGGAARSGPAAPDEGTVLEMRLARVTFWEGCYSRRGIDLQRHFGGEPLTVTDLDLLAFAFTPQLRRMKTIGEAKTGTSKTAPRPLDRVIWLAGLMPVVGAESAELVTAIDPAARVRELGASLHVRAMNVDDLGRREDAADISAVSDLGAHGPVALDRMIAVHRAVKGIDQLERAFWFLRSEVWFLAPWAAVKRSLGLIQQLTKWWSDPPRGVDGSTLRWLFAEAISVFTLNVVTVLEPAVHLEPDQWRAVVQSRLAEGAVPMHQMRKLSASVDEFLAKVLAELRASATMQVEAMGAFLPRPPDYADPFAELTSRLARVPSITSVPRHVDLLIHERLVHRRDPDPVAVARVTPAGDHLGHVRRLFASFLRGHGGLPDAVDRALITDTPSVATGGANSQTAVTAPRNETNGPY
jgi:hypothetical protein